MTSGQQQSSHTTSRVSFQPTPTSWSHSTGAENDIQSVGTTTSNSSGSGNGTLHDSVIDNLSNTDLIPHGKHYYHHPVQPHSDPLSSTSLSTTTTTTTTISTTSTASTGTTSSSTTTSNQPNNIPVIPKLNHQTKLKKAPTANRLHTEKDNAVRQILNVTNNNVNSNENNNNNNNTNSNINGYGAAVDKRDGWVTSGTSPRILLSTPSQASSNLNNYYYNYHNTNTNMNTNMNSSGNEPQIPGSILPMINSNHNNNSNSNNGNGNNNNNMMSSNHSSSTSTINTFKSTSPPVNMRKMSQSTIVNEYQHSRMNRKNSVMMTELMKQPKRKHPMAMSTDLRKNTSTHDTVSPIKKMMSTRFLSKSLSTGVGIALQHSLANKQLARQFQQLQQQQQQSQQQMSEQNDNVGKTAGGRTSQMGGETNQPTQFELLNQYEDNVNLEVWPANVEGYENSNSQVSKMIAKPKVLFELERTLDQLLVKYKIPTDVLETDQFDISHTQPYRECFRMFVDQFKTYKPFLTKIRNAYERAIEYALEKVRDSEYLKNQIHLMEQEFNSKTDERIIKYTQEFFSLQTENAKLKDKIVELEQMSKPYLEQIESKSAELRRSEEKNSSLEATVFNLKELLKRLDGESKTWEIDMESLNMLEEEQKKVRELQERIRLKDMQIRKLQETVEGKKECAEDPQLAEIKSKLTKRNTEYMRLKAQMSLLLGRLGRLEKDKLREMREVERLQKRLEPFMEDNANLTPRPAWNNIIGQNPKALEVFRSETTQTTVAKIVEEFLKIKLELDTANKELEEARNFIGLASRDSRLEEIQNNERVTKWFLGLGTGKEIQKFLQFKGKIANRKFSKGFTEEMINEFWEKKEEVEEQLNIESSGGSTNKKKKRIPAKEFYYQFLEEKAMEEIEEEKDQNPNIILDHIETEKRKQKKIAEWSYSMMDSLKKALYDPDCEMFYKIVYEDMSEDVFYEQNDMLQSVKQMLQKLKDEEMENEPEDEDDEDEHTTRASSKTELLKSDILKGLREMFPLKPEESFRRLIVCLNKDFPGLYVDFIQLFEEDEDYNQREFVEEIRHQFVVEREDFLAEIEESVIECDANNDGIIQLSEIHQAIMQVDPLRPISQVDNLIAQGLNVSVNDLNPILSLSGTRIYKGRLSTPISKFIERIRQMYVFRYTALRDRDRILAEMKNTMMEERTLMHTASMISVHKDASSELK